MSENSERNLKPCPFCGGAARHNDGGNSVFGRFWWAVWCEECQIEMRDRERWNPDDPGRLHPDYPPKECFARWNNRKGDYSIRWPNKAVDDVKASFAGALRDIRAERKRQVDEEGWTAEHDDSHAEGELALAGAAYAIKSTGDRDVYRYGKPDSLAEIVWPWALAWLKPTDRRRDLVKAGALIVAEIERIDRAAAHAPSDIEAEMKRRSEMAP